MMQEPNDKKKSPIKSIVPIEPQASLFGKLRGSVHEKGDIIMPIDEKWNASLRIFNSIKH